MKSIAYFQISPLYDELYDRIMIHVSTNYFSSCNYFKNRHTHTNTFCVYIYVFTPTCFNHLYRYRLASIESEPIVKYLLIRAQTKDALKAGPSRNSTRPRKLAAKQLSKYNAYRKNYLDNCFFVFID